MKTKPTKSEDPSAREIRKTFQALGNGDFVVACKYSAHLKDNYPNSRIAEWLDIVMTADRAEYTSRGAKRLNDIRACVLRLKRLTRRMKGLDRKLRSKILNEFYYFSRDFKKQIKLGNEDLKKKDSGGLYSIGVGSTWYALQSFEKGELFHSLKLAETARDALAKYVKKNPRYSNTYFQLSLAFELLGQTLKADTAFADGRRRLPGNSKRISTFFQNKRRKIRALAAQK